LNSITLIGVSEVLNQKSDSESGPESKIRTRIQVLDSKIRSSELPGALDAAKLPEIIGALDAPRLAEFTRALDSTILREFAAALDARRPSELTGTLDAANASECAGAIDAAQASEFGTVSEARKALLPVAVGRIQADPGEYVLENQWKL
jgi:hypothetical protein